MVLGISCWCDNTRGTCNCVVENEISINYSINWIHSDFNKHKKIGCAAYSTCKNLVGHSPSLRNWIQIQFTVFHDLILRHFRQAWEILSLALAGWPHTLHFQYIPLVLCQTTDRVLLSFFFQWKLISVDRCSTILSPEASNKKSRITVRVQYNFKDRYSLV